jgi:hypothetical protein
MEGLNDIQLPDRESAPFIFDVGGRVLKGAVVGYLVGLVFFKSSRSRRFFFYYGAGFGLGMNYTQLNYLYRRLIGTHQTQ